MIKNTLFYALILSMTIFNACKNDDNDDSNSDDNGTIVYALSGTSQQGNYENDLRGSFTINQDNSFVMATTMGSLEGVISDNKSSSNLAIESSSGYFDGAINLSGTIDMDNNSLNVDGESETGDPIVLTSDLMEDDSGEWTDGVSKSTLWFTHYEDVTLNITIGNQTFGPIEKHYNENGYCEFTDENGILFWDRDMDSWESGVETVEGTIEGQNGSPVEFSHNVHAQFVLEKEQEYTYIAEWSDGTYYEGSVSTTIGGMVKPVCIEKICGCAEGELEITENTLKVNGESTGIACCDVRAENLVFDDYLFNNGFNFGGDAYLNQDTAYSLGLSGTNNNLGTANILFSEGQVITNFTNSGGFTVRIKAAHEGGIWYAHHTEGNQGSVSINELVEENGEVIRFTLQFNEVVCSSWDHDSYKIVTGTISAVRQ
jgi:hypothetical protein